jgi:hypothetical protein
MYDATAQKPTHLFVIIKDAVTPEWTGTNNVTIRQNITALCIYHETCGLARH